MIIVCCFVQQRSVGVEGWRSETSARIRKEKKGKAKAKFTAPDFFICHYALSAVPLCLTDNKTPNSKDY